MLGNFSGLMSKTISHIGHTDGRGGRDEPETTFRTAPGFDKASPSHQWEDLGRRAGGAPPQMRSCVPEVVLPHSQGNIASSETRRCVAPGRNRALFPPLGVHCPN